MVKTTMESISIPGSNTTNVERFKGVNLNMSEAKCTRYRTYTIRTYTTVQVQIRKRLKNLDLIQNPI